MKKIFILPLAMASITTSYAQIDVSPYKNRVDSSITNKTAAASITRQAVGGRFKELADMLKLVQDSSRTDSIPYSRVTGSPVAPTLDSLIIAANNATQQPLYLYNSSGTEVDLNADYNSLYTADQTGGTSIYQSGANTTIGSYAGLVANELRFTGATPGIGIRANSATAAPLAWLRSDSLGNDQSFYFPPAGGTIATRQWVASQGYSSGSGSGNSAVTLLTGTVWDGSNKQINLSANTALTTSTFSSLGVLLAKQNATGGYTLSINGTAIAPNTSANAVTAYGLGQDAFGGLFLIKYANYLPIASPPSADITPPVIVSVAASDAHTFVATLNEASTYTNYAGWGFSNGSALTVTAVAGAGTAVLTFTVSETMSGTDALSYTYSSTSGNTADMAGNSLSTTSGSSTNNISSTLWLTLITTPTVTESPTHTFNFPDYLNAGVTNEHLSGDGYIQAEVVAGSSGMSLGVSLDQTIDNNGNDFYKNQRFLFVYGGTYQYNDIPYGYGPAPTGVSWTLGDLWRIRRAGTTLYGEYSSDGGTTWNLLVQFSGTFSQPLFGRFDPIGTQGQMGVIKNLKGGGWQL